MANAWLVQSSDSCERVTRTKRERRRRSRWKDPVPRLFLVPSRPLTELFTTLAGSRVCVCERFRLRAPPRVVRSGSLASARRSVPGYESRIRTHHRRCTASSPPAVDSMRTPGCIVHQCSVDGLQQATWYCQPRTIDCSAQLADKSTSRGRSSQSSAGALTSHVDGGPKTSADLHTPTHARGLHAPSRAATKCTRPCITSRRTRANICSNAHMRAALRIVTRRIPRRAVSRSTCASIRENGP